MPRDDRQRSLNALVDMLVSSKIAVGYLEGVNPAEFAQGMQIQDSVIRRIEIVGEAAKRVDEPLRPSLETMTALTWPQICGMRDLLIHQYDGVDLNIVYKTVKDYLPPLIDCLDTYLKEHNHQNSKIVKK